MEANVNILHHRYNLFLWGAVTPIPFSHSTKLQTPGNNISLNSTGLFLFHGRFKLSPDLFFHLEKQSIHVTLKKKRRNQTLTDLKCVRQLLLGHFVQKSILCLSLQPTQPAPLPQRSSSLRFLSVCLPVIQWHTQKPSTAGEDSLRCGFFLRLDTHTETTRGGGFG